MVAVVLPGRGVLGLILTNHKLNSVITASRATRKHVHVSLHHNPMMNVRDLNRHDSLRERNLFPLAM